MKTKGKYKSWDQDPWFGGTRYINNLADFIYRNVDERPDAVISALRSACFFGEKSYQVSVIEMTAFGIPIGSKTRSATEMAEMLLFCESVTENGYAYFIDSIYYDSLDAASCDIKTKNDEFLSDGIREALTEMAVTFIRIPCLFGVQLEGRWRTPSVQSKAEAGEWL